MPATPRSLPPQTAGLVRRFPSYPEVWSFEPSARWVRGIVDDVTVVDSRHQILVWEPRHKVPEYGFARGDVRTDLLVPGEPPAADRGFYRPRRPPAEWFDLRVGDRIVRHAAWRWDVPELADYLGVNWFAGVLDRWLEEDEVVMTHPRDPFSRVDALPSSRHVVVSYRGRVLAESADTVIVYETGLPPRYYFPPEAVDLSALEPSATWSECPYKGYATRYWSLPASAGEPGITDVAWSYADPKPVLSVIAGRIAFFSERVDLVLDGVTASA
ncbi:MAG: DUF427 domain-containing protein [Aeromicrobium sp.]